MEHAKKTTTKVEEETTQTEGDGDQLEQPGQLGDPARENTEPEDPAAEPDVTGKDEE
jgi:hypothetical protein